MSKEDKKDILECAKKFKKSAQDYWQRIYDQGLEDKKFVTLDDGQWDKQVLAERQRNGVPTLQINITRAYIQQHTNSMRQNRPQSKVVPVDDGADLETAKILAGLIKDVEEASNFENALDTAAANQVHEGFGFYRITTDYIDEKSFNQEPRFQAIVNSHAVLIDPHSKELDGSDMNEALVCEWVDIETLKAEHGDVGDFTDFEGDDKTQWMNDDDKTICVAEYFFKDRVKDTLYQLPDGTIELESEVGKLADDQYINSRSTTRTVVKWVKLTGNKVLEETIFPGRFIPIFPIYGEVTWVENERHVFSLVHFAKEPQRLFNYWKSSEAEVLQRSQNELPPIVDDRGIAGYEEWNNPSSVRYLRYKAVTEQGEPIPFPTRIPPSNPPVGILNAAQGAQQLIPDILNMHSPQMGQEVNNQSGRAIGLLQRQADTAQFHFQDNVNKTIRHSSRVLLELFPVLYDTQMVRRIIGSDGDSELVKLNAEPQNETEQDKAINGILNDLSIGRFDVHMDTGPAFNTQREESFALMLQLVQSNPALFNIVADLMIRNSPLLNAKEIADRVKMLVPPQALGKDNIDPEQAKAQIQQLDQVVQKMTADLEALQKELTDKNADRNLEMMKVRLQAEKDIQVAQIAASSRSDVQELRSVAELIKLQLSGVQDALKNVPPQWLEQGEGVDNYAPLPQEHSQTDWQEPPPDLTQPDIPSPPSEGFLMPEPTAQLEQLAPDLSQFGDSAMATDEQLLPSIDNGEPL